MIKPKTPDQLATDYVTRQMEYNNYRYPEWSTTDIEIAWYDGYTSRDEEVAKLKQEIEQLKSKQAG